MQELGRMIKKLCSKLFSRIVITGVLILIQAYWFWSLFTSLSSYAHWLNPLMIALSVIMCAVLIRQDSTAPEFKISWMVLFMIMPVQGGLLYLLWGDKRPAFRLRKKLDWAYDRIRPLRRTDPAAQAMLEQANGARIYDLDSDPVRTRRWTELESVRDTFEFFQQHKEEF